MTTNVVAMPNVLSPERLAELRGTGVTVDRARILQDLALPEPSYGEQTIGELTDDELFVVADLTKLKSDLETAGRELVGKNMSKVGDLIRTSDHNKPLMEVLQGSNIMENVSEEEAKLFFTLQQRVNMVHSTLHYHLGERFDAHDWRLGIRSRGRVVKIEHR